MSRWTDSKIRIIKRSGYQYSDSHSVIYTLVHIIDIVYVMHVVWHLLVHTLYVIRSVFPNGQGVLVVWLCNKYFLELSWNHVTIIVAYVL